MEENTLDFFNSIFETIPQAYKQVPKDYAEIDEQSKNGKQSKNKNKKQSNAQPLSMMELKERAQKQIESIHQLNREKSVAKIK